MEYKMSHSFALTQVNKSVDPYYVNLETTLEEFLGPRDKWSTLSNVEKPEGFEN
jgi:hypothetical protein